MREYYFTFGTAHRTIDGYPLREYWVRVIAKSAKEARRSFMDWCELTTGKHDGWASQYSEDEFESVYFPRGEYALIE